MAHTPGPWCYEQGTKTIRSVPTNYWLASMDSWDGAVDHKANTSLIVASPDLRRFAQEIAALDPQDFDAHMGEALIRRARALVVKADGAT